MTLLTIIGAILGPIFAVIYIGSALIRLYRVGRFHTEAVAQITYGTICAVIAYYCFAAL